MYPRVPQILPHFGQEHLHLFGLPLQELREKPDRESLEAFLDFYEIPAADCFLWTRGKHRARLLVVSYFMQ